jgi:hypothetical protein
MGEARSGRRVGWATAAACALLLAAFAGLSYSAALTKTATIDEPTHLVSGWLALRRGDYRLVVANPAGWEMFAALAVADVPLQLPPGGPLARDVGFDPEGELLWAANTLYGSAGVDGDRALRRARAAMLAVNLLLGAAVAGWAYRLAGPVAAVVACGLFALDPNVLAHASLVKSDLPTGLTLIGMGWICWRSGQRLTAGRVVALGVTCAVAVNLKFTGALAGPIIGGLFLIRSLSTTPWPAFGGTAATLGRRLAVSAAAGVGIVAVALTLTWAVYRFRYRPAPSPAVSIDMSLVFRRLQGVEASVALGRPPTPAEAAGWPLSRFARAIRWADDHQLLPQPVLAGIAHQAACVALWEGYLNGEHYFDGRVAYFPLAVAYKTPLPELAAFAAAALVGCLALRRVNRTSGWAAACVAVPAVAFGVAALRTHLNIGVRTVLPMYALADVAAGCAAAWAWGRRPRLTGTVGVASLGLMAITAAAAWPDYLPFFNAAVGGPEQGLAHLADSNVDWGQDVPALAQWQRAHPDLPLYLDLFTAVDPAKYGVRSQWLWTPDAAGRPRLNRPDRPAVIAISATHVVGVYCSAEQRRFLATLLARPPRETLHGTIYLFDYPPR